MLSLILSNASVPSAINRHQEIAQNCKIKKQRKQRISEAPCTCSSITIIQDFIYTKNG